MLPLPPFAFDAPDRWEDAFGLAMAPGSRILAGGTDLLPSLKHRLFDPSVLVSLARLPDLTGVRDEDGGLSIGAMSSLSQLARHPLINRHAPALAAACATVATPTLQGMATLGGNLMLDTRCVYYNQPDGWRESLGGCLKADGLVCHVAPAGAGCYAAHSADTVPALWLYGASVELRSRRGVRRLPVSSLYGEDGRTWLRVQPGEILTRIHIPLAGAPVVHRKVRLRGSIDYAALLVAVRREGDGARAVLSALGPRPVEVSAERAEDLPELAWKAAKPLNTHVVSTTWRKHMARVEVRRALADLSRVEVAGA